MSSEHRDRTSSPPQLFTAFVGNLSLNTTKDDIFDLFGDCGDIVEVFFPRQGGEICFKYGFVRFRYIECVKQAISDLNGWMLKGNRIKVERAREMFQNTSPGSTAKTPVRRVSTSPIEKSIKSLKLQQLDDSQSALKNLQHVKHELASISDTNGETVDSDALLQEVKKETASRPPASISKLYDLDLSVDHVLSNLSKCYCKKSLLCEKKTDNFRLAMKKAMLDIQVYLETERNTQRQSSSAQDDLTGSLPNSVDKAVTNGIGVSHQLKTENNKESEFPHRNHFVNGVCKQPVNGFASSASEEDSDRDQKSELAIKDYVGKDGTQVLNGLVINPGKNILDQTNSVNLEVNKTHTSLDARLLRVLGRGRCVPAVQNLIKNQKLPQAGRLRTEFKLT